MSGFAEKVLGPDHSFLALILENYSALLRETGRIADADGTLNPGCRWYLLRDSHGAGVVSGYVDGQGGANPHLRVA